MSAQAVPDVRAAIPCNRVPPGTQFCQTEAFPFDGSTANLVVRELTAVEFADMQTAAEASGVGPMLQQIDFVGRCLCDEQLSPMGVEFAGRLPRTVMARAAEMALRLNGLVADEGAQEKKP